MTRAPLIAALMLLCALTACGEAPDDDSGSLIGPEAGMTSPGPVTTPMTTTPAQTMPGGGEPGGDPVSTNPPVTPGAPIEGASGKRGECGFRDENEERQSFGDCQSRKLPGTGHDYCVKAHPDCSTPGAGCFVVMTFNMGSPHGLSATYRKRVDRPNQYGKYVVVGGGSSADHDVMAELPRAVMEEFPGVDPSRIYVLGNSRGAGAVNSIAKPQTSMYGSTWDVYAAAAIIGGGFKPADDFSPADSFHLMIINAQRDIPEPKGPDTLAKINGCTEPEATWANVPDGDAFVPGADGTDIAQRLAFGSCPKGDVLAYRFRDEKHVADFQRNFNPKVRAIYMAWDFFQGRRNDSGPLGSGSACYPMA